jgi:hypothetical protein
MSEKLVPELLMYDQTEQRAKNGATFMPSIITGDETWVYGNNPETKQKSQ